MFWAILISAIHNWMCVFSLFWSKKVYFEAKIFHSLHFYGNQHFIVDDSTKTIILYLFKWKSTCTCKNFMYFQPSQNQPNTSPNLKFCFMKIAHLMTYLVYTMTLVKAVFPISWSIFLAPNSNECIIKRAMSTSDSSKLLYPYFRPYELD